MVGEHEYSEWQHAFAANVHQSLDAVYDEYSMFFVLNEDGAEKKIETAQLKQTLRSVLGKLPEKELMVNPPASHVLQDGHVLVVMGLTDDLQELPKT